MTFDWISPGVSFRLTIFILLVCLCTETLAQATPDVNVANQLSYIDLLPPTPAVASLSDFSRVGGGLSSGSAQFNVPLTFIKLNGVSVPIALSYSSGGIKVDELASRVGMGWQLSAGGSVSRVMQGAVDENSTMIPIPQNETSIEFYDYIKYALTVKPQSNYDNQPDLFSFDVCGLSGKFYLNDNNEAVLFPKSNLKITTNFSGTDYTFIITDTKGNKFFLGGDGYIEKSKRQGSGSKPFYQFYPTAWFLRKIEPYNGGEITFYYKAANYTYDVGLNQTMYFTSTFLPDACDRTCPQLYPDITINYVQTQTHYLDSIHSIDRSLKFEYVDRQDYLMNEVLLKKISVFENNASTTVIEAFDFEIDEIYTEAYSNSTADQLSTAGYRPFLITITKTAGNITQVLNSFEYYSPENLPVRLSFSQDHWGYFNGQTNSNFIPKADGDPTNFKFPGANANREVNESTASIGMLKKITYPTMGYDVIQYESNSYHTSWGAKPTQDTVITYSRINTGGTVHNEPFEFTIYFAQEVILNVSVGDLQLAQSGPIKSGSISLYDDEDVLLGSVQEIIENIHDPNAGENNQPSVTIYLTPGTYHGSFHSLGKVTVEGEVTYTPGHLIGMIGNKPVGGVRVKSIKGYSFDNTLLEEKHYKYCSLADTTKSSLSYFRNPAYSKFQESIQACSVETPFTCAPLSCQIEIVYSSSIVNLNPFSGNHILYSHVIEYSGPTMDNGSIEHEYFTTQDEEGTVIYGEPIIGAPLSNSSIVTQNREKTTTIYRKFDSGFKPVKRTSYEFTYDTLFDQVEGTVVNQRGLDCLGLPADPPSPGYFDIFEVTKYDLFSPWTVLESITEELFTIGQVDSLISTTQYEYSNTLSKLPTKATTMGSDGKETVIISKFVNDTLSIPSLPANQIAPLGTMAVQNIVTPLIYQEKFVDGNKISEYRALYSDNLSKIYPSKVSQYAGDGTEIESFEFLSYDANGNVTQRRKNDGVIHSYLWDYNNQFVVAEVKGAAQSHIAATSFESTSSGNWSITGNPAQVGDDTSPTGKRYGLFTSGGSLVKTGLTSTTSYVVSYWYKSGTTVNIPGSSGDVVTAGQNGWIQVRKKVTGVTSVTVSVSSNGAVDEVRLYPENATMTTNAYQPGVGLITTSDANDLVTYFYYDTFNRLIEIKNDKGNLLKTFKYHYKE